MEMQDPLRIKSIFRLVGLTVVLVSSTYVVARTMVRHLNPVDFINPQALVATERARYGWREVYVFAADYEDIHREFYEAIRLSKSFPTCMANGAIFNRKSYTWYPGAWEDGEIQDKKGFVTVFAWDHSRS